MLGKTERRLSSPGFKLLLVAVVFALIAAAPANPFPQVIPLPNGFRPEGIATGRGTTFFVGSIPTGAVFSGDLMSGKGSVLVPPHDGRSAIGLKFDGRTNLLYVAGGPTGAAFIYDAKTGADVAALQLTTETDTFINDVVVTRQAVYFTDSSQPVLYRLPLANNGSLPDSPTAEAIPLSGDYEHVPGAFNLNGIAATPNGKVLIVVSSALGALFQVDPTSGYATRIDLGADSVPNGDGILLAGKTLYVVQNFLNQVAVIQLDPTLTSGSLVDTITSPNFRIPTTIARFGNALYVVNARFDTPPTPDTDYNVVQIER